MENLDQAEKIAETPPATPPVLSLPPEFDEIPEAVRDPLEPASVPWWKRALVVGGSVGLAIAVVLAGFALMSQQFFTANTPTPNSVTPPAPVANPIPAPDPVNTTPQTPIPLPPPPATPETNPAASSTPENSLLGHFQYEEAPQSELAPIVPDGSLKLRKAAAQKFTAMVEAARQEGVTLVPISGFRSIQDQNYLFFEVKQERGQATQQRAEVSAPPGYSEHHTGYAVDIGDGTVPATNLSPDFENTPAFQWLKNNAARFSFELSFLPNNPQGIMYEPWHWRYVGDIHSLETFFKARGKKE